MTRGAQAQLRFGRDGDSQIQGVEIEALTFHRVDGGTQPGADDGRCADEEDESENDFEQHRGALASRACGE
jgi:hypothetical protein